MKIGLAFSTKDRVELTRQTIKPLLQPDLYDLWWMDGSATAEGRKLPLEYPAYIHVHSDVRGGPDAAIVYSLTTLLQAEQAYEVVGLVENDVLLDANWFPPTLQLFERGRSEGLEVGAVSARAFADRILVQRDGYGLMHNLGAGMVLFSRKAAEIVLANFRTGWTTENRRTFAQLCHLDIGRWYAFGVSEHMTCADWQFDRVLAAHGLASLALCPSPVEMIGQVPPLAEQGLHIADKPFELLRNDDAFTTYAARTAMIRNKEWIPPRSYAHAEQGGATTYFAHQIGAIGGRPDGAWRLRWFQGFGPFGWEAVDLEYPFHHTPPGKITPELQRSTITIHASGPCGVLVSGGRKGGQVLVEDLASGYSCDPVLRADPDGSVSLTQLSVPAGVAYRDIRLTALTPGVIFHGVKFQEPQPVMPNFRFDHSILPPV